MQEHRKLACYRDGGAFLGGLAATCGELQAVATQIAVRTEAAQDPVCSLDQQASQAWIASLADAQLWVAVAGSVATRTQAEPRTDLTAACEPLRILDGQHVRDRGHRADAIHLLQVLHLGVVLHRGRGERAIERSDLRRELLDHLEDGGE